MPAAIRRKRPASYLYNGPKHMKAPQRRRYNMMLARRFEYLYRKRRTKQGRTFRRKLYAMNKAQIAAHPTLRSRFRDNTHTARKQVTMNKYLTMPIKQRRRVDVPGWDTRYGQLYAYAQGARTYARHHRQIYGRLKNPSSNIWNMPYLPQKRSQQPANLFWM